MLPGFNDQPRPTHEASSFGWIPAWYERANGYPPAGPGTSNKGTLYVKSPVETFTISVVSTGSKLVASGAVGPAVNANSCAGPTTHVSVLRIRKTALNRSAPLFRREVSNIDGSVFGESVVLGSGSHKFCRTALRIPTGHER